MKKRSYIIFGAGKFGRQVAEDLTEAGMNVLVVDHDPESISMVADSVTKAVIADVTDARSMEALGLSGFDGAIIATTGDLSASVMGIVQCQDAGIPWIVAKASDETQAKVFRKLGADRVIIPETESAARVVRVLLMQEFLDVIMLSDTVEIAEITTKKEWAGKSLKELRLPAKYHINVIAVRENGSLYSGWNPDKPIPKESSLVVVGDKHDIAKLPE